MRRVLTAAEMREADRRCIEDVGIPGAVLMNTAGAAVWAEAARWPGPVGVVCGRGNNGGDGFVVARLALCAGRAVRVVLIGDPAAVTGDAAVFLRAYERLGGIVVPAPDPETAARETAALRGSGVLVDALLGTGFMGEVRGAARAAIGAWPEGIPTVAVDIPSGLNADTGEPGGAVVRADTTVTFACLKRGLLAESARPYTGRIIVADIGIPEACLEGLGTFAPVEDR